MPQFDCRHSEPTFPVCSTFNREIQMRAGDIISAIAAFDPRGKWFQQNHPTRAPKADIFDIPASSSEKMMVGVLFDLYSDVIGIEFEIPDAVWTWVQTLNRTLASINQASRSHMGVEPSDYLWFGASRVGRLLYKLDGRNSEVVAALFRA
jgi:hypothetical protein